jgi:two-component system, cell cycle response regulator
MARILVIDDSPEFRLLMAKALSRAQHETIDAANGEEGLRLAIVEQPDLILLDYMMPGMNGFEVAQELHSNDNTAAIPVLMITAFSVDYDLDLQKAIAVGIDDFLTKPVSPRALIEHVDALLVSHRGAYGLHTQH